MSKHIGNDCGSHTHFRIVDIDSRQGSVLVEYDENLWLREQRQAQEISWVEFVEGLRDGRFEIHRNG
jgi:phage terminase large subunit